MVRSIRLDVRFHHADRAAVEGEEPEPDGQEYAEDQGQHEAVPEAEEGPGRHASWGRAWDGALKAKVGSPPVHPVRQRRGHERSG